MSSWLSRLFGVQRARPADAAVPAPRRPDAAGPPTLPGAGCRWPLVNGEGRLCGFEFRVAEPLLQRFRRDHDVAAEAAHTIAVLQSMRGEIAAHRTALVTLPLAIVGRPAVLDVVPAGAMIAFSDAASAAADTGPDSVLARLSAAGARLGTVETSQPWSQFIVFDARNHPVPTLVAAAKACQGRVPGAQIVAKGLPDVDSLEVALRSGVDLAAGVLDRAATRPPHDRNLSSSQQRVCQLLNRLARDDELAALAADLRLDVELSYRLLRWANSPLMALSRPAESVEQAVMLIGRDGLYRWLMLLLLTSGPTRPSSRALHEVALARARLLEALAPRVGAPGAAMFTVGLLSLLEVALNVRLDEALQPLKLPAEANDALLRQAGPWHPALAMARAVEQDAGAIEPQAAEALGGLDWVLAQAEAAWAWAAQTAAQLRAGA